jgi:redox-sensitive bicupin YhaK (pirin superfamily)
MSPRDIETIVTAHQQREGEEFLVRRPVSTSGLDQLDPFLMLDEVGPVDYGSRGSFRGTRPSTSEL